MPVYYTHDNGGRPFKVDVDNTNKSLVVYQLNEEELDKHQTVKEWKVNGRRHMEVKWDIDLNDPKVMEQFYDKPVFKSRFREIFIGTHEEKGNKPRWGLGNSILINKTGREYVFIGETIYSFTAKDHIVEYHSPIGNSDVPYPFAIGDKYVYFMIEYNVIDVTAFDEHEIKDPYTKLYGHDLGRGDSEQEKNARKLRNAWHQIYVKKFDKKTLVKRQW